MAHQKVYFVPFRDFPSNYYSSNIHNNLSLQTGTRIIRKGKAVPLQDWSGPEGPRKLMFPDFVTTAQDSGKVVSLMHRLPLPPGKTRGTRFCQRLSGPQGHSATGRIMSLKNSCLQRSALTNTPPRARGTCVIGNPKGTLIPLIQRKTDQSPSVQLICTHRPWSQLIVFFCDFLFPPTYNKFSQMYCTLILRFMTRTALHDKLIVLLMM